MAKMVTMCGGFSKKKVLEISCSNKGFHLRVMLEIFVDKKLVVTT
jgi:hypothetical protein